MLLVIRVWRAPEKKHGQHGRTRAAGGKLELTRPGGRMDDLRIQHSDHVGSGPAKSCRWPSATANVLQDVGRGCVGGRRRLRPAREGRDWVSSTLSSVAFPALFAEMAPTVHPRP